MDDGENKGKERREAGFDHHCWEGFDLTCGWLRFLNKFIDFCYRAEVEAGEFYNRGLELFSMGKVWARLVFGFCL